MRCWAWALVQFAEVGYWFVVEKDGGRAAGLEPCRRFRGEGDGSGASGGAEEREEGFDGSLELEERGVLGDVEGRGRLRRCGGEAEGEGRSLVDVGDVGGVGWDGAGEGLALLEEADFFYVAVEIVAEHVEHAGDQGWAQEGGFLGEGVLHGDWGALRGVGRRRIAVAIAHTWR